MPLLDVLQSVPILSFLPVVLIGLSVVLPQRAAAELAAVVLIFTSQAWNMTFSFYQSSTTVPTELREAAAVFRFRPWTRFTTVELPFGAVGLIWNSMMSWAGGWFFLMASEVFNVGARDFRLPGLGSYLQSAAVQGDTRALLLGVATLVLIIVLLDQLLWRPILAWADRFKLETADADGPPGSWLLAALRGSRILRAVRTQLAYRLEGRRAAKRPPSPARTIRPLDGEARRNPWVVRGLLGVLLAAGLYGAVRAAMLMSTLHAAQWGHIGLGLGATFGRVALALGLALLWTVPVGILIGSSRRLAGILQPVVQVLAAIPATALFPLLVLALLRVPGGLNIAAVLLMLLGTQWYLLFNVIAGASSIPQELRYTTSLLGLSRRDRWRTLLLPSIFPFLITGAITAGGGAWNASIVAEYVKFGDRTLETTGVGALIAEATAKGEFALLLASTLALVLAVVAINRLFWARLYRRAEERFRME
jgi:NitT/TauT family transport system permease protein